MKCGWAGLGSVGCGGSTCIVYIKGAYAKSLTVNMHELGHTQGLSHAGRGYDEVSVCLPGFSAIGLGDICFLLSTMIIFTVCLQYGDTSDVMGTASSEGYLCMNVGNQHRVGWNQPIATLYPNTTSNSGNAGAGRWIIPAASLTDTNNVYLVYNVNGVKFGNYFVSFRTRGTKYDNIMPSGNMNKASRGTFVRAKCMFYQLGVTRFLSLRI